MSRVPRLPSPAASSAPVRTGTGRVSVRDPDGGRHLIEVLAHGDTAGPSAYQIRVDGWYHAGWARTVEDIRMTLDRIRRAVTAGWLPGDADLPD